TRGSRKAERSTWVRGRLRRCGAASWLIALGRTGRVSRPERRTTYAATDPISSARLGGEPVLGPADLRQADDQSGGPPDLLGGAVRHRPGRVRGGRRGRGPGDPRGQPHGRAAGDSRARRGPPDRRRPGAAVAVVLRTLRGHLPPVGRPARAAPAGRGRGRPPAAAL